MKFAVCVETIFTNLPFLERLEKVKETGVEAFEFWEWKPKDIDAINKKRKELGLSVSSFVIEPILPSLVDSDVSEQFCKSTEDSIKVAQKLECGTLIAPVGLGKKTRFKSHETQLRNALKNIEAAKPLFENANITMVIEPVNLIEHKNCFLSTSKEGAELIREISSPNIRLVFDFYHLQISEENVIENMKAYYDLIGLFHIGDYPGRHQPGTGKINFGDIFKFLSHMDYKKYISMEFTPTIDDAAAVKQTLQLAESSK
jgi:hydroxypyruvate isomerase